MKVLDSFMRESQRFSPPFAGTSSRCPKFECCIPYVAPLVILRSDSFRRYVQKPITFKDGTHISAGTFVETPSLAVLHDPDPYPDPEVFNPYRRFDFRTKDDVPDPNSFRTRESYQFVSVTKETTSFG